MKILIISDIHANPTALKSIKETYDYLICLGDLVDYGPDPRSAIDFVRKNSYKVVRGNHDNALAFGVDCGCSYTFKHLSIATREYHREILDEDEIEYLRSTPLSEEFELGGARFFLAHASPQGDLYKYLKPDTDDSIWRNEIEGINADFIFVGHTHLPVIKEIDRRIIVNPGSVGQPRDGIPQASYAIWEDGRVTLKRVPYDIEKTISALMATQLDPRIINELSNVLRKGR